MTDPHYANWTWAAALQDIHERLSAVEGLSLSPESRARLDDTATRDLTPAKKRAEVLVAYQGKTIAAP